MRFSDAQLMSGKNVRIAIYQNGVRYIKGDRMTKRLVDDENYIIIPKKCIDEYNEQEDVKREVGWLDVILPGLFVIMLLIFVWVFFRNGWYFNPDVSIYQY